jgi:hypothetical protein
MAHYCRIDENNIVQAVNVIYDREEQRNGMTDEVIGSNWCHNFWQYETPTGHRWLKCSYNGNIRKNYPGKGYSYDEVRDAFIPPKPYPSWTLNEQTCLWDPPYPKPVDGNLYNWDENLQMWVQI